MQRDAVTEIRERTRVGKVLEHIAIILRTYGNIQTARFRFGDCSLESKHDGQNRDANTSAGFARLEKP
jgi:hypothetical protein